MDMSPICVVSHTYALETRLTLGQKFREVFHSSLEGSGWFRMVQDRSGRNKRPKAASMKLLV